MTLQIQNEESGDNENQMELRAFKSWKNLVPQMEKHRPGTWTGISHTHRIQNNNHSKYKKEIFDLLINEGIQVKPKVRHLFLSD